MVGSSDLNYYVATNSRGDVETIYTGPGAVKAHYTYDTWGKVLSVTDANGNAITDPDNIGLVNPIRYRGYYYDADTGFYYLQSRYYDPDTGRFLNADSQIAPSDIIGLNAFAYCENNPVNMADLDGHCPFFVITAVIGAVAGAVVGGVVAAANGGNVWAGIGIGAAAGALIGTGVGAAAGAALAGSIVATTAEVACGASALVTTVAAGGIGAGATYVANNLQLAGNEIASAVSTAIQGSGTAPAKSSQKIISTISNDVVDLPRVGSALKIDPYHAFPDIVDNYVGYAARSQINNGTLYQLQGSLNGLEGRFEWIVQNQQVMHRYFVEGGEINGIPIMP